MSYVRRNVKRNNEQRLEQNEPQPAPKLRAAKPKANDAWVAYLR